MSDIYTRNRNVVERTIAGETILVPVSGRLADMRRLFSLNATAEFVWGLLERPVSAAEAANRVAETYDVASEQAALDVSALLSELLDAGLIETSE